MLDGVNPLLAELGILPRQPLVNPLAGLPRTGKAEVDAVTEIEHLQLTMREKERREKQRQEEADDQHCYAVLIFERRSQRDAFLEAYGMKASDDGFVNGMQLAAHLGIAIPDEPLKLRTRAVDVDFARLTGRGT